MVDRGEGGDRGDRKVFFLTCSTFPTGLFDAAVPKPSSGDTMLLS
jgi:hypothetical protein